MSRAGKTIGELVTAFRLAHEVPGEDVAGLALISADDRACRMVAAFARIAQPQWERPRGRAPTDPAALWGWLWTGYAGGPRAPMFLADLAVAAGVSDLDADEVWPVLMASRMVRPDWTIADDARLALRALVMRSVPRPSAPRTARGGQRGGAPRGSQGES
jgi:hypothetical protein